MTDVQLLAQVEANLRLAANVIRNTTLDHRKILAARDLTQAALSHLQGLENRFRQGLINDTETPPPTSPS